MQDRNFLKTKFWILKIFIDKPEGIDIEDCEKVNDIVNPLLDKADYIKEQYFLEVSSPGIERILRKDEHLKQNIGTEILVKLFQKDEMGKKAQRGILKSYDQNKIIIEQPSEEISIERKNISQIKTVYHW